MFGTIENEKEDSENNLPLLARGLLNDLANQMKDAKRLMSMPSIGEINAIAVVATLNDAKHFNTSRSFATWIILIPRQYSTGGKAHLGRTSKRGEKQFALHLLTAHKLLLLTVKTKRPHEHVGKRPC